jgi:hypothetical protein
MLCVNHFKCIMLTLQTSLFAKRKQQQGHHEQQTSPSSGLSAFEQGWYDKISLIVSSYP